MAETLRIVELLTVRLVPSIALDYEARGIFPSVRLVDRPGRVPVACNVALPREAVEAMLADARVRPEQLRRAQSNFKGGAVMAWRTLVRDLEWALLPKEEQSARTKALEAQRGACARGYDWFIELDNDTRNPALRSYLNEFRGCRDTERHLASLENLRREIWSNPRCAMRKEMLGLAEAMFEAHLERLLDAASWRAAGAAIERVSRG